MPLNPKQQHAILMLTLGVTKTQTAQRCGVARSTLDHWLKDPAFSAQYDANLNAHLQATGDAIQTLAREAIIGMAEGHRMLRMIAGHEEAPPHLRTQASQTLVKEGRKWLDRLGYDAKPWDVKTERAEDERAAEAAAEPQASGLAVSESAPKDDGALPPEVNGTNGTHRTDGTVVQSTTSPPAPVPPLSVACRARARARRDGEGVGGEVTTAIQPASHTPSNAAPKNQSSPIGATAAAAPQPEKSGKTKAWKGKGSQHVPFYRKFQRR